MPDDPRWLRLARTQIGQTEVLGREDNPVITGYWRRAGVVRRDHTVWTPQHDETPWCAAFIGAMLADSGIAGSHSEMARSYGRWGDAVATGTGAHRWASIPLGAIVVLNRPSAGPTRGHVGFASGAAERSVRLIGGNQNDSVSEAWLPKTRIVAVRWPTGEAASEYLLWSGGPPAGGRATRTG